MARSARLVALIGAILLVVVACGGGGGGSPTAPPAPSPSPSPSPTPKPTPTPSPTPSPTPTASPTPSPGPASITFTASGATTGIVLAQGMVSTDSTLVLEVQAAQVTGLYGVAFDLDYPSSALRFRAATAGAFLAAGNVQVSTQVVETKPGHLVIGVSRLGQVSGVDGSGVLITLQLDATASGSGAISFSKNSAYRPDGSTQQVSWGSGTVTVVH